LSTLKTQRMREQTDKQGRNRKKNRIAIKWKDSKKSECCVFALGLCAHRHMCGFGFCFEALITRTTANSLLYDNFSAEGQMDG
jgi:hypothetical protein